MSSRRLFALGFFVAGLVAFSRGDTPSRGALTRLDNRGKSAEARSERTRNEQVSSDVKVSTVVKSPIDEDEDDHYDGELNLPLLELNRKKRKADLDVRSDGYGRETSPRYTRKGGSHGASKGGKSGGHKKARKGGRRKKTRKGGGHKIDGKGGHRKGEKGGGRKIGGKGGHRKGEKGGGRKTGGKGGHRKDEKGGSRKGGKGGSHKAVSPKDSENTIYFSGKGGGHKGEKGGRESTIYFSGKGGGHKGEKGGRESTIYFSGKGDTVARAKRMVATRAVKVPFTSVGKVAR
ncbi:keratin, type I cytoskeletal 9-like [Venturia canescens]|uniref:keratin, type I cytoskeletal 9-like n=1 Tax=Venturia canescens TaxID=32260 RepID=UPI001C9C3A0B|nr:keratin, type I cytoskeletal 9-like [Venturia canescens]